MFSFPLFLPQASIGQTVLYAYSTSDWFGKGVVIILVAGSIVAWSIMLTKWRDLGRLMEESKRFLAVYRREANPLMLFAQKRRYLGPLAATYNHVCQSVAGDIATPGESEELLISRLVTENRFRLQQSELNMACKLAERTTVDQSVMLESHMGFLATVVTAAPFLGLLGTVWGVMDAFRAMAESGSVMLSAVAPGISGALLTTVVGLLVALPSLIGYNMLNSQIQKIDIMMENFAEEFTNDLERNFLTHPS